MLCVLGHINVSSAKEDYSDPIIRTLRAEIKKELGENGARVEQGASPTATNVAQSGDVFDSAAGKIKSYSEKLDASWLAVDPARIPPPARSGPA